MPKEFLIFKAGNYPQGDYSKKEILEEFVNRFNSNKQRMSVFIGHKRYWNIMTDEDELSHGEVIELRLNSKNEIWASDYWFDDYVIEKISKRQLLNCSPEIYGNPEEKVDILGLALLGRTPPANPFATLPLQFFNFISGKKDSIESNFIGCFKFDDDFRTSFRDINIKGEESMTEEEKKVFSQMQEDFKNLQNNLVEANRKIEILEKEKLDFNKESEAKDSKEFFMKLQSEGKIPPAIFEKAVSIDSKLSKDERVAYRELFSTLAPIVELGTHSLKKEEKSTDDNKSNFEKLGDSIANLVNGGKE